MKTLYILRHAKSDWSVPGQDDTDRPIREKGIKRTGLIIKYMISRNEKPDLIMSSHALRAVETSKLIARGMNYPVKNILVNPRIYYWNEEQLGNVFYELDEELSSLLIVGHNPAFTNFANLYLQKPIEYLPTSGLVCVKFNIEKWQDLDRTKVTDSFAVFPKMLKT